GPDKITKLLVDALKEKGVEGLSLLDIGGGIGAIQHELIQSGARLTLGVDGSAAYLKACKEEAERQNHAEKVESLYGDFVHHADKLREKDIVTLDKTICCYPDVQPLVSKSSRLAKTYYGLVYPRVHPLMKLASLVLNAYSRIVGSDLRMYLHSPKEVEHLVISNGFRKDFHVKTLLWQVVLYSK
ncbi:MAG: class I SAM-dependent methyltransferase, partial [Spirochaetota bacterium]|nr:class I SAM-dependent methyltransferase [Spirochaetota bacterium]